MKRKHVAFLLSFSMVLANMATGAGVSAKTTDPEISQRETEHAAFSSQIAQEGMVLLENRELSDGSLSLPIQEKTVALFGTGAVATIKGGRGSGAVNNRYTTSFYDALIQNGYTVTSAGTDASDPADYIMKYVDELERQADLENGVGNYIISAGGGGVPGAIETEITEEQLAAAMTDCNTAIYVVARDSGENCERSNAPGDYYLSETEYHNLEKLGANFENVIVLLNTGSALDTNFFHGKSAYSESAEEYVKMDLPDEFAFDADQYDRERDLYYISAEENATGSNSWGWAEGAVKEIPEDAEFDYNLADPATDATSITSTSGYYYWDPQYGTENTTISNVRHRSVIFNHMQDAMYTYDSESDSYEPVPGDVRYDKDTDYYMFNVFRPIEGLDALVYVSQAGQDSGNAMLGILNGTTVPSGKLTDTWAVDYYDFPSSATFAHNDGLAREEAYTDDIYVGYRYFDTFGVTPAYAFGYGMSYTQFETSVDSVTVDGPVTADGTRSSGTVTVTATVTNVGDTAGKEVVEVYYSAPEGKMEKAAQDLADYGKTELLAPGESQTLTMTFDITDMASYDMETSAYVLEAGDYIIRVGNSSRNDENDPYNTLQACAKLTVAETTAVQQLKAVEGGVTTMDGILSADSSWSIYHGEDTTALPVSEITFADGYETPAVVYSLEDAVAYVSDTTAEEFAEYLALDGIAEVADGAQGSNTYVDYAGNEVTYGVTVKKYDGDYSQTTLKDVYEGSVSLEEFVSTLTLDELSKLVEGSSNTSEAAAQYSVQGAAGETYGDLLESRYIANMVAADGPAGVRISQSYEDEDGTTWYQYCTAWPIGTLLAQTWNKDLIRQMGDSVGEEMLEMGVTLWLAPGMNIHRNPLCGRNFEYYSEDPVVTGTTAAQLTLGVEYGYGTEPTEENFRGISVTLKHFYGNQQESYRQFTNNTITERAIREIYLKAFQIAVEDGHAASIMTSYNNNNGIPAADDRDLCTVLPRDEWGFDGIIMTDWGGGSSTPGVNMHAGNDLVMPGRHPERIVKAVLGTELMTGTQEQKEGDPVHISVADVQKSAMNILKLVMRSTQFRDYMEQVESGAVQAQEKDTQVQVSFEIMDEFNNLTDKVAMSIGQSALYEAKTDSADAVETVYASSDESVAAVDAQSGEVTAVAKGTAVITATVTDAAGMEYSAQYTVEVTE